METYILSIGGGVIIGTLWAASAFALKSQNNALVVWSSVQIIAAVISLLFWQNTRVHIYFQRLESMGGCNSWSCCRILIIHNFYKL